MATTSSAGECPVCGSEHITYGAVEFADEALYYPLVCDECGAESKEWYNLAFVVTVSDE